VTSTKLRNNQRCITFTAKNGDVVEWKLTFNRHSFLLNILSYKLLKENEGDPDSKEVLVLQSKLKKHIRIMEDFQPNESGIYVPTDTVIFTCWNCGENIVLHFLKLFEYSPKEGVYAMTLKKKLIAPGFIASICQECEDRYKILNDPALFAQTYKLPLWTE